MSEDLRRAIDRILIDRSLLDETLRDRRTDYLFPSPTNPDRPISKDLASNRLERAEALAACPSSTAACGMLNRRKWVTQSGTRTDYVTYPDSCGDPYHHEPHLCDNHPRLPPLCFIN